jgi:hypothetical protein
LAKQGPGFLEALFLELKRFHVRSEDALDSRPPVPFPKGSSERGWFGLVVVVRQRVMQSEPLRASERSAEMAHNPADHIQDTERHAVLSECATCRDQAPMLQAYERLRQWAASHTKLAEALLKPESAGQEQQSRKHFQNSLEHGRELLAACHGTSSQGPSLMPPMDFGLAPLNAQPTMTTRRDGRLPLSGSLRFGTDPVLGGAAGRGIHLPEDTAQKHHHLAPSRSYSKKKAF